MTPVYTLLRGAFICSAKPVATRLTLPSKLLCQDVLHYVPVHVRQPEVAALEPMRESLVVEAEQVEDRGVEVVDVDGVFDGVEAEVVRLAVDHARLHAAA